MKLSEMPIKGGNFRTIADHYSLSIKKFFNTNKNKFKHVGDVEIYPCYTLDNIYILLHNNEIIFICTLTTYWQDDEIDDKVKQLDSVWLDKSFEGKKIYSKVLWFARSRLGIKRIVFGDQHSDDTYQLLKGGGLSAFTKSWYNKSTKERKQFSSASIDDFYNSLDWKLILESNKIGDELTEEVKNLRFPFVTNPLLGYTSSLYDWQIE
jgi:hypothetical protein